MSLLSTTKLLPAQQYAQDIIREIRRARTRVAIITTTLANDDDVSEALITELVTAAARGVKVSVGADSLTFAEPKESLFAPHKRQSRARRSQKIEKRLRDAGAEFRWLGRLSTVGFTGRTHTKWCVVDDIAYSCGGVNLDKMSFLNVDYMLRFKDKLTADVIYAQHHRVLQADKSGTAFRSRKYQLNNKTTLLIDGGIFADSVIYRRAKALAKKSEHVVLVSQYCPTGPLATALKKVESHELYFNHWRKARWLNRLIIRIGMRLSNLTTTYHRRHYLHAKFILFTLKDGKKVAISGSHNFVHGTVLLGTREVAIETTDKSIIKQLETFFIEDVK